MRSISGIYDGKEVKPLEDLPKGKKYKVIITLVEEIEEENLREYGSDSDGFEFWEDPQEDIYQDYLKKEE